MKFRILILAFSLLAGTASIAQQRGIMTKPIPVEAGSLDEAMQRAFMAKDLVQARALASRGGVIKNEKAAQQLIEFGVSLEDDKQAVEWAGILTSVGVSPQRAAGAANSPLFFAVGYGNFLTARALLLAGADANGANGPDRVSALAMAVSDGDLKMVELLLAAGASANVSDKDGMTPLHWAASADDAQKVRLLLAAGAAMDAVDKDRDTPLHLAADNGATEAARVLVAAGANVTLKNKEGLIPLRSAVLADKPETMTAIAAGGRPEPAGRAARRTEIMKALNKRIVPVDLGFKCENLVPEEIPRGPSYNSPALARRHLEDMLALASRFGDCVADYAGTSRTREQVVPSYRLMFPMERAEVDRYYDAAARDIVDMVNHKRGQVQAAVDSAVTVDGMAQAGAAADRRAAAESRQFVSRITDTLVAIQERYRPPPKIDPYEFAERVANNKDQKSAMDKTQDDSKIRQRAFEDERKGKAQATSSTAKSPNVPSGQTATSCVVLSNEESSGRKFTRITNNCYHSIGLAYCHQRSELPGTKDTECGQGGRWYQQFTTLQPDAFTGNFYSTPGDAEIETAACVGTEGNLRHKGARAFECVAR